MNEIIMGLYEIEEQAGKMMEKAAVRRQELQEENRKKMEDSAMEMEKELEFIPQDGIYALPYVANAAGVLYNKDMFEEHGWEVPETWSEFTALCEQIESEGIQPLYLGCF